jgi:AAA domain
LGPRRRGREVSTYEETAWEYEVAWRLERTYELRGMPEAAKPYDQGIDVLIPRWLSSGAQSQLRERIERVKQIAFPSVLEILRSGMGNAGTVRGSSLAEGLEREVFDERSVSLEFQHRMHPDISRFPRVEVYEDKLLRDSSSMAKTRSWEYPRYSSRCRWIHVDGRRASRKNENQEEADVIIEELDRFRSWTRSHPRPNLGSDSSWEVAVLAFYRPQESTLRVRLRSLFGQPLQWQKFEDRSANLRVSLGTVDRFQGQEADIVFLSFVRTRGIGFLDNPNRLNVALTRARYQLVMVGNHRLFSEKIRSERGALLRKLAQSTKPDYSWAEKGRV